MPGIKSANPEVTKFDSSADSTLLKRSINNGSQNRVSGVFVNDDSSPIPPTPPPRVRNLPHLTADTPISMCTTEPWCKIEKDQEQHPQATFFQMSNSHLTLLSTIYPTFSLTFWLDRLLLWTGVYIPLMIGAVLVFIHAFLGISRCMPEEGRGLSDHQQKDTLNPYIDQACGLQLSFNILQGTAGTALLHWDEVRTPYTQASLQHECYPFVLLIIALFMWAPHFLYQKSIEENARRDLCFIRGELHSFRESLARELVLSHPQHSKESHALSNQYQTIYQKSTTQVPFLGCANFPAQHAGLISPSFGNATKHGSHQASTKTTDADFSAPGISDLPYFESCHNDWSLNTYLSLWQDSHFYWSRFLLKHALLAFFQFVNIVAIVVVVSLNSGAPFAALFKCRLKLGSEDTTHKYICMLTSTFLANMSVLMLGFLCALGLTCQGVFFYRNVFQLTMANRPVNLGTTERIFGKRLIKKKSEICFFEDYIRLLAYASFRVPNKEIRNLTVSVSPAIFNTDFHMLSLLCLENMKLFPDALHIHFWMERYSRLVKNKAPVLPSWIQRTERVSQLVRCEDLSMKFNFSKIRMKLEIADA
ncbi:hypothetical protein Ciccas_012754 [Cichlidogyrus casuarinus]|uniref:Uncharacterized protein n=1 Tax=Cichlidogyrus casuarinus TaxID=1844966 RepID=A0ABD2PNJ1_9PLAT